MKITKIEFLAERDDCGCLEVNDHHNFAISSGSDNANGYCFVKNSILENYFLPASSEGRGSDVTSIGGNSAGFTQLDDVYYFSKKLYRALKYPMSRLSQENNSESLFGNNSAGIERDEIRWAKMLEKHQRKFANDFVDLFLLHLDFKGFKKQYNLNSNSFTIKLKPPSHYKEQMTQTFLEQRFQNYNALSSNTEFSKTFLIKKYLLWNDNELEDNKNSFKLDRKYFPSDEVMDNYDTFGGAGSPPGTISAQLGNNGAMGDSQLPDTDDEDFDDI